MSVVGCSRQRNWQGNILHKILSNTKHQKKLTEVHSVLEQYIKLRSLSTVFQLDKQAPDAEFAKQVNSNHSKLISFFLQVLPVSLPYVVQKKLVKVLAQSWILLWTLVFKLKHRDNGHLIMNMLFLHIHIHIRRV